MTFEDRLFNKSKELDWNGRGIREDHPEVKIVLALVDLEQRFEELQHASGQNNLRIIELEKRLRNYFLN